MQSRSELGEQPIGRLLTRLAVPTITAQLVNMLYNLVDRIYIGHIEGIGTDALTGVGVCFPIIMLISAFTALAAMGAAPRASIEMGKGDNDRAEKILGGSAVMLLGLAVVLTVVFSLWNRPILLAFGASENTIVYATRYMSIYCLGTVFVQGALGLNAFITAQGFAKESMMTVLIGAVLNTLLDPLFIFVFGMDVQGAALATVISQAVSAAWVVKFLCGKKAAVRLRRENLRFDGRLMAPCVALGLSPFIMQSTESLLAVCFNSSLLRYGGDMAVGAMTILSSINQFALLPLHGLTQAAQPIVSFNYGAMHAQRVKQTFFLLLRCCVTYSTVLWLLVMLCPGAMIGLFTPDPVLTAYTIPCLRTYLAACLLFGVQVACQQTFVALGNAKSSLFLACLRKLILLIPLIYIMPLIFADQVHAVFLAEPVADVLAVLTTATMFFFQFRRTLKRMHAAEGQP